tara:strand:- start:270 stop:992 length:723 start_codon:yes stop_codon:yes gene_type:complete
MFKDPYIFYFVFKRISDLVFSLLGLFILSPLFLLIILILKHTAEKEVFYLQERMGLNNNPFYIYKFATMIKNSQNTGSKTVTLRNDPRVTRFGKILRFSKINELPQILNVIKGDMSLVGPRPLLTSSFKKYTREVQEIIYKNKPGITGLGSLIFRDEELLVSTYKDLGKDPLFYYKEYIYPFKGTLELFYHKNLSFLLDMKILFLTFFSLLNNNSNIVFKIIKGLPSKPDALRVNGIKKI